MSEPIAFIEGEESVLGACMLDPKAYPLIAGKIFSSDFTRAEYRAIFEVIKQLDSQRLPVDAITVAGRLEGRVDLAIIGKLARDTPTAENVEQYAAMVRDRAGKRELRTFGERLARLAAEKNSSAAELMADAQKRLHDLQAGTALERGLLGARELVDELTDELQDRSEGAHGLHVGLDDLDEMTGGLGDGELMVIGARPSMGKTALLMNIASIVSAQIGVAVFSAEMPSRQLTQRLAALRAPLSQTKLRKPHGMGDGDWDAVSTTLNGIVKLQLGIDDKPAPTVPYIRAKCIAMKARASLGLVMIDYLQLMRGEGRTRYEELSDISYALKALAKELQVPVVVLAQLNREVEKRGGRPISSDLRDCGVIEEAADQIVLLHAEGFSKASFAMPHVLELLVPKNRSGVRGKCLAHYDRDTGKIENLDADGNPQYQMIIQRSRAGADDGL